MCAHSPGPRHCGVAVESKSVCTAKWSCGVQECMHTHPAPGTGRCGVQDCKSAGGFRPVRRDSKASREMCAPPAQLLACCASLPEALAQRVLRPLCGSRAPPQQRLAVVSHRRSHGHSRTGVRMGTAAQAYAWAQPHGRTGACMGTGTQTPHLTRSAGPHCSKCRTPWIRSVRRLPQGQHMPRVGCNSSYDLGRGSPYPVRP